MDPSGKYDLSYDFTDLFGKEGIERLPSMTLAATSENRIQGRRLFVGGQILLQQKPDLKHRVRNLGTLDKMLRYDPQPI